MGSSLSSRLDHHQLLAALSIEAPKALPTTVQCPVCKEAACLDVAKGEKGVVYRCRKSELCGFQGDGIELFAIATRQDIQDACHTLVAETILTGGVSYLTDLNTYLSERELKLDTWMEFWNDAQAHLRNADTYTAAVLGSLGLWESRETTCSRKGLGAILGAATGSTILETLVITPQATRQFKKLINAKATYLVMPMWVDYATVSGFTIISRDGAFFYIPVPSYTGNGVGVGLIQNYTPFQDPLLAAADPVTALLLSDMGFRQNITCPVVYLDPETTSWDTLIAKRSLLVATSHSLDHYKLALKIPDCRVTPPEKAVQANKGTLHATIANLAEVSQPTHILLANLLCKLDQTNAIVAAQHLNLSVSDSTRVIGACPESKRELIKGILNTQRSQRTITIGNDEIATTSEGWTSKQKGLVLNCSFYVDKVIYDPNIKEGTAIGTILKDEASYSFTASLKDIQKRTLDWLSNTLMENCAGIPIALPGWANKLWNISIGFKEPITVHSSNTQGWVDEGSRLVLPHMVIVDGSITSNSSLNDQDAPGYALQPPKDMEAYEAEALCFDDNISGCFWALFAAICANVHSPFHKFGTHGIAVIDSEETILGEVVDRAIEEIGLPGVAFTTGSARRLEEIKNTEAKYPLPIYVAQDWNDNHTFGKWLRTPTHNCLVKFDKTTAIGTSLDGGWVYISCKDDKKDSIGRIQGLWKALPLFFAWLQRTEHEPSDTKTGLLESYLRLIEAWLSTEYRCQPTKAINRARTIARIDILDHISSYGARLVNFIIEHGSSGTLTLFDAGDAVDLEEGLIVDNKAEKVFISETQLSKLFDLCGLLMPGVSTIRGALKSASLLAGTTYKQHRGFVIDQADYNFQWAMRA